jgi:hypothetical protein
LTHFASSRFWAQYQELPEATRALADKRFALLKADPTHPSLRFKKVGRFWSARVSLGMRALAVESGEDLVWFWIGDHREYERIIKRGQP